MPTKQVSTPVLVGWTALVLAFSTDAFPITWNFDTDGDAQGWTAAQGIISGERTDALASLYTEIFDGIWRIAAPPPPAPGDDIVPSVQLVSPRIGHDSALFDRVTICMRVVQPIPSIGNVLLRWTNPFNESGLIELNGPEAEQALAAVFNVWQPNVTYSTDWREYTVAGLSSGAPAPGRPADTLSWQGPLLDIRPELILSATPVPLSQWPQSLEVDWIRLNGVEEQLQGELPPPTTMAGEAMGTLFTPLTVSPVDQQGLAGILCDFWPANPGGLGDLDGDGELELVLQYWNMRQGDPGWVELDYHEGGRYSLIGRHPVYTADQPMQVVVSNADRDNRSDLLCMIWGSLGGAKVLLNHLDGWVAGQEWPAEANLMGWADGDGDGRVDAWGRARNEGRYQLLFYRGLGDGSFAAAERINGTSLQRLYPSRFARDAGPGGVTGILQAPMDDQNRFTGQGYVVTHLGAGGDVVEDPLAVNLDPGLVRYAGDVDGDGDIDLLAATEVSYLVRQGWCTRGVSLWLNQGDGSFSRVDWLPEAVLSQEISEPVLVIDLDGDGRKDYALVDVSERQPSLWVGLGQPGGGIRTEGRYLLEGGTYGPLYAGDLDSDGYLDLITVRGDSGSEGVCVWRNNGYRSTAIGHTPAVLPASFRLASNYPNPFNPRTLIPLQVPATDQPTRLRVYNLLGQPVRTLVNGRLQPGSHTIPWDGTDDHGRPLPSGVYLCRFQSAGYQETIRMAKVD